MLSPVSFRSIHQFCHICLYLPTCLNQTRFTQLEGNHVVPPGRTLLLFIYLSIFLDTAMLPFLSNE